MVLHRAAVGDRPLHVLPVGPQRQEDGSVVWRVWAPLCDHVELVLGGDEPSHAVRMSRGDRGYHEHRQANVDEGARYCFRLPDGGQYPDPMSLWQPDGVHRPSAVFFPERYEWHDGEWRGIDLVDTVLYEIHIGTFTPEGTFDAAIARLPELKELGVTAIEIMPVHQFPGGRNWGYDGVHAFAVQNTYGGPRALQRLVDAAHREGLAVVLDVVYNHFGPEGNYLGKFGPYFSDRYHTPWGSAVNFDTPGSDPVRWHFIDNALYWVRHFHVDGLRLDATHEIYDHGPLHILEELQAAVQREAGRRQWPVHVVAESDRNDPRLIRAAEQGGYALDGTWSDDFHHAVHALLTGDRTVYYRDFGSLDQLAKGFRDAFVFDGQFSEYRGRRQGRPVGDLDRRKFVVCVQNHDQVGNRPQGDRLSQMLPPAALRLACGVMLISPYVPLLFMGEEYGEQRPFPFFCSFLDRHLVRAVRRGRRAGFAGELRVPDPQAERTFRSAVLTWQWPEGSWQAAIRRLYCDLLRARRRWDALRDRGPARSRLLAADGNQPCLMVERGAEGALLAVANCSAVELPLPSIGGNRPPLRLSTESACYGGTRSDGDDPRTLLPYEMLIYGVEEVPR